MFNNNTMYGGYQPQPPQMLNPYQTRFNALQNDFQQRYEIVKVNGENGARAFNLPPNSGILLLDETAPIVWLKQTDGAGYPTLTPYSITPYQAEPPIDTKSLEQRVARLEELLNDKSHNGTAKSKADAAKQSNAID